MPFARVSLQKSIIREKNFPSGVPINGLPGWENVPLHLKLPMLQTPSNQERIIFSRAKVGKDLFRTKGDFDARILEEDKIRYNPLHDRHLRKFFSSSVMVRQLLHNDEITDNLDVRCNLKEFNQFRVFIHKACLEIMTQRSKETEEDQKDRSYVNHAFTVAKLEEQKPAERSPSGYIHRKNQLIREKYERNLENWLRKLEKIRENEMIRKFRTTMMAIKKQFFEKKVAQVLKNEREIMRLKEIIYKKNLEVKEKRCLRARKANKTLKEKRILEKSMKSYNKRLQHKSVTEQRNRVQDLKSAECKKQRIEAHIKRYRKIWDRIERRIAINAGSAMKYSRKTIPFTLKGLTVSSEPSDKFRLSNANLKSTLNLIIDQERNQFQSSTRESFLTKERTVKYVVREILQKFKEDLSGSRTVVEAMCNKLEKCFLKIKQQQIRRAIHIIAEKTDNACVQNFARNNNSVVDKQVSFTKQGFSVIGKGSYEIDEDVDIKRTKSRPPTPTESLTSIGKQPYFGKLTENDVDENDDEDEEEVKEMREHEFIAELPVNAKIFVEHLFVSFKKRVIKGVGKIILDCLCHYKATEEIINKADYLGIPMDYLKRTVAKSILSYAVDQQSFEANIMFCTNTLASQIISNLVQYIQPKRVSQWDCMNPICRCNNDF